MAIQRRHALWDMPKARQIRHKHLTKQLLTKSPPEAKIKFVKSVELCVCVCVC